MFSDNLKRISEDVSNKLLRNQSNGSVQQQISFHNLAQLSLPTWLLGHFNIILNPKLGGQIQLGTQNFDFTDITPDSETLTNFKVSLNQNWSLSRDELSTITLEALHSHISFLIDPARSISTFIFDRQKKEMIPANVIRNALDSLTKIVERWNEHVASAIGVVKPYITGLETRQISSNELTRVLGSAIEKELATNPLEAIQTDLSVLESLLSLDPAPNGTTYVDFTEPICRLLTNRGLTSWTPAVVVERTINEGILNVSAAIKAMKRLEIYREHGVLGSEPEDPTLVEDEVDNFTNFLDMVTE
jgi:hypothetical protein